MERTHTEEQNKTKKLMLNHELKMMRMEHHYKMKKMELKYQHKLDMMKMRSGWLSKLFGCN